MKGNGILPGYITHNIFGIKEFKIMQEGVIKSAVRKHRNVFYVGNQGPDIFFYYPGYFMINRRNLGSIMHTAKTGEYMTKILDYILNLNDNIERDICIAYFAGFLSHYTLDRTCHPYIYWKTDRMHKTKDYHAKHVALETDIDFLFCKEFYKKNISNFPYKSTCELSKKELHAISAMLSEVLQSTFSNIRFNYKMAYSVLLNFKYIIGNINDKTGIKEKIVGSIEEKLLGHKHFTTLFIRDNYTIKNIDCLNLSKAEWFNPWKMNIRQNYNFYELTEQAGERYLNLMKLLEQVLSFAKLNYTHLDKRQLTERKLNLNTDRDNKELVKSLFVKELGNYSFLTDLLLD